MSAHVHDSMHPLRVQLRRRRFRPALELLPRFPRPALGLRVAAEIGCGPARPELPHVSVRDAWAATARLHVRHMA